MVRVTHPAAVVEVPVLAALAFQVVTMVALAVEVHKLPAQGLVQVAQESLV